MSKVNKVSPHPCEWCHAPTENPKFCSLSCSAYSQNAKGLAGERRQSQRVQRPCEACAQPTLNPLYCSRKCARSRTGSRKKKPSLTCEWCAVIITGKGTRFCTQNCAVKFARWMMIFDGSASAQTLKKGHIDIYGVKCSICLSTDWFGKPIPVILDHVNGHADDNTWENTRLVCPNCDTFLPTFKGRNKGNGRHKRRQRYAEGKSY